MFCYLPPWHGVVVLHKMFNGSLLQYRIVMVPWQRKNTRLMCNQRWRITNRE